MSFFLNIFIISILFLFLKYTESVETTVINEKGRIASSPSLIQKLIEESNKLEEESNDFHGAIQKLSEAIDLDPSCEECYLNRGTIYFNHFRDYEKAYLDYSTVILFNGPNKFLAYRNRALLFESFNMPEHAMKDYSKMIQLVQKFEKERRIKQLLIEAHSFLGHYFMDTEQDYERSNREFSSAISYSNFEHYDLYHNRGVLKQSSLFDYENAIEDYTQAILINPKAEESFNNRGICYDKLQDYERALEDFNKAISLNPKQADFYVHRGSLKVDYNRSMEDAFSDFKTAIQIDPTLHKAYYNRGRAYFEIREFEKAIEDYTKSIKINDKCYECYLNRGITYRTRMSVEHPDLDFAMGDFNHLVLEKPDFGLAYLNRAWLFLILGNNESFLRDLEIGRKLSPNVYEKLVAALDLI